MSTGMDRAKLENVARVIGQRLNFAVVGGMLEKQALGSRPGPCNVHFYPMGSQRPASLQELIMWNCLVTSSDELADAVCALATMRELIDPRSELTTEQKRWLHVAETLLNKYDKKEGEKASEG